MKSKFKGTCKHCGGVIFVGEEINWSRESGATHVGCTDSDEDEKQLQKDIERGITPLEGSPF